MAVWAVNLKIAAQSMESSPKTWVLGQLFTPYVTGGMQVIDFNHIL
jgi:hypothetical protein